MNPLSRLTVLALLLVAAFAQAGGDDTISVSNGHSAITFSRATGGIVDIANPDNGHSFISTPDAKPSLWKLRFRGQNGEEIRLNNSEVSSPQCTAKDRMLTLEWQNLALGEESKALDVRVQCHFWPGGGWAHLQIWVDNSSTQYGLWEVSFPVITGLGGPDRSDVAMGRGTWGMLYHHPKERIQGKYPSHALPMQFILVQENRDGLYLAAHDPKAFEKSFTMEAGKEFRVDTPVMDMGVPGNDWSAPYPFVLSVYEDSWMGGCKQYRAWVTHHTPWTKQGPLESRKDIPEAITRVTAWLCASGGPEEVAPAVKQFAEAIGTPVGVHWYNWHQIPFDTYYPDYFPTKPGFAETVRDLTSRGITVMPYINSRLWDSGNENFKEASPAAVKDATGDVTIETYGSGAKLAVMCPSQLLWQKKVEEIIQRLGTECGVNAVYLDQIASAPPRWCFDPQHGHTLGAGSWWVDRYRDLLTPIKRWCTSGGRSIALTSENNAEPYMDNIDANLIWTERSDAEIPMNTAVYSGYSLYFASNRAFQHGDVSYCMCQARDFVWGSQLGWDGVDLLKAEHEPKLKFLARLAQLRAKAADFMVYGELLDLPESTNTVPTLSGTWNKPGGDGPVTLKAVQAALWKNKKGDTGVFLANADTESHPYGFEFDSIVPVGSAAVGPIPVVSKWNVKQVSPDGVTELPVHQGSRVTYTVDVPARDALLLVFNPVWKK
ncbi:MAG TPA: DUF6259 domain-containing protein [bacterium]|nr:DUF6259 domain-containing protein [bacterium]